MCHKTHKRRTGNNLLQKCTSMATARLANRRWALGRMHYFAPSELMQTFEHIVVLTAPLFILVLLGYGLTRWAGWPKPVADALTRFVFSVGIPALLFRLMGDFFGLPAV